MEIETKFFSLPDEVDGCFSLCHRAIANGTLKWSNRCSRTYTVAMVSRFFISSSDSCYQSSLPFFSLFCFFSSLVLFLLDGFSFFLLILCSSLLLFSVFFFSTAGIAMAIIAGERTSAANERIVTRLIEKRTSLHKPCSLFRFFSVTFYRLSHLVDSSTD